MTDYLKQQMPSQRWQTYFVIDIALINDGKPTIAEYHEKRKRERKINKLKAYLG